ncbi:type 1 glutamine amidotransferase-like domain-containing protein [Saccharibacillus sp. VR-M41]|uniref:Type 1 glutamine amidotransferase-like domain-containing protein n=2 Tax=Saccharibacillus alkalitolerans TaxID=2705290 RepID=A0ABX0F9L6_9BACL|nr:type 1 glutamine amidotransferase-like domain-containing protein [Saccharibacillus alkalitolerans]
MGGGGFSMEPDNPVMDRYILEQSGRPRPKVCFLAGASGDDEGYIRGFLDAFGRLDCRPSCLRLASLPAEGAEAFLLSQDVIYVGGGDTHRLMRGWREAGIDGILRRAWEAGIVLAGLSAGSICWFEEGITDLEEGVFDRVEGLGLIPGSHCPHYNGCGWQEGYRRMIASGGLGAGLALTDGAAAHYAAEDGSEEPVALLRIVGSRPEARAYRLGGEGDEHELPVELLR